MNNGVIIGFLAVIVTFGLALRWVVWWYFGINRIVRALEDIELSLRTLPSVRQFDAQAGRDRAA